MKALLLTATLAALALDPLPAVASGLDAGPRLAGAPDLAGLALGGDIHDRRGRGRGRGEEARGGDRDGGHGGRPRIPGGSGCDDPWDVIEHPECRG